MPYPGGCNIGKRPITEHLHAFSAFGYHGDGDSDIIRFSGSPTQSAVTTTAGFAVTATENTLMLAAFEPHTTVIQLSAIEPHVINLIHFLRSIGVKITIDYDHTITVEGIQEIPRQAQYEVIADYIESGTFIIL